MKRFLNHLEILCRNKRRKGMKQYNEDTRVFLDDLEDYLNDLKAGSLVRKTSFDEKMTKNFGENCQSSFSCFVLSII